LNNSERVVPRASAIQSCPLLSALSGDTIKPQRSATPMQKFIFAMFFLIAALAANGQSRVPAGSKVFIAPMEGSLDGFIAPEIIKKKLPLVVVTEEDAEYILTGASIKADDKWYHVISVARTKTKATSDFSALRIIKWSGQAKLGIVRSGGAAIVGAGSAKSQTVLLKR
jgi:hypothetical protein